MIQVNDCTRTPSARTQPARRAGFSLVEVMISMTVISVAVVGVMGSITSSSSLADSNRESSLAYRTAQRMIERIQGSEFTEVWALYNGDDADDPGGVGTAPGMHFDIVGFEPQAGDADGRVGRISFPISVGGPSIVLLEDLDKPNFNVSTDRPTGLVRPYPDDTDVSAAAGIDPSGGYLLLPVRVEVEWTGASGERSISVDTVLAPR